MVSDVTHRLTHTQALALHGRFHKMHHRFHAPEAICGVYAHMPNMRMATCAVHIPARGCVPTVPSTGMHTKSRWL